MFTPVKLGNTTLPPEVLKADKKSCKRYGPCGVGEQALYLNSFFIDRRYYVALESVRRVFKRVAMSKGGFTGKGAFGSIPYLVVELDDGSQKQCNFKHEEDVDLLLAHMARVCPDIPRHSVEAERRLREKAEREAKRYLKQLTPQAQAARETLEQAQQVVVDDGICRGMTIAQVAEKRPVNLRFYLIPGKSKNNMVRAAAQLVLNSLQKAG